MALSRDTIKILLFALLCIAMVGTLYYVNRRVLKEKFAGGVPALGQGVGPFGCTNKIDNANKNSKNGVMSLVPDSGFCDEGDGCCEFLTDIYLPDMMITGLISAAQSQSKLPHELIADTLLDPPPPKKDPLTGEALPRGQKDMLPYFRLVNRMQALNMPTNVIDYNILQASAKASKTAKAAAAAAAGPDFTLDKSGTGVTGRDVTG